MVPFINGGTKILDIPTKRYKLTDRPAGRIENTLKLITKHMTSLNSEFPASPSPHLCPNKEKNSHKLTVFTFFHVNAHREHKVYRGDGFARCGL